MHWLHLSDPSVHTQWFCSSSLSSIPHGLHVYSQRLPLLRWLVWQWRCHSSSHPTKRTVLRVPIRLHCVLYFLIDLTRVPSLFFETPFTGSIVGEGRPGGEVLEAPDLVRSEGAFAACYAPSPLSLGLFPVCIYCQLLSEGRMTGRKKKMRTFLRNVLAPLYWQSIKCYSNTARRGQTFHCRCQGAADEDELVKWERVFPWDFSPAGLIIRTAGRIYVGASVLAWGEVEHTLNRGASCQRTHPSTAVCFKLHSCWHVSVGTA